MGVKRLVFVLQSFLWTYPWLHVIFFANTRVLTIFLPFFCNILNKNVDCISYTNQIPTQKYFFRIFSLKTMHCSTGHHLVVFSRKVRLAFSGSVRGHPTCIHPTFFFFCPQNPFSQTLFIFWLFCTNQGSNGMLVWLPLQKEIYNLIFKMFHSVLVFRHISRVSKAPVSTSTYLFSLKMCLYGWQKTIEDF